MNVYLKIVHRDLKCENVFLNCNEKNNEINAYVGNFGNSICKEINGEAFRMFDFGMVRFVFIQKNNEDNF